MTLNRTKLCGLAAALALLGGVCGYVAEAHAIDRAPFLGRPLGDGGPGYGAERQYYGAEGIYRPRHGRAGYNRAYGTYGSFVDFGTGGFPQAYLPLGSFYQASRAGVYPGFGGSSSFVYVSAPGGETAVAEQSDSAKVVNVRTGEVETEQPGVSVRYIGTAKVISIAPGTNLPKAVKVSASTRGGSALEPWSEGWERYCTRTHPDFDPARGTFTDANGRSRFCTGE